MNRTYWMKQATKHERAAATFMAKFTRTQETRWLKQAKTNQDSARRIRAALGI